MIGVLHDPVEERVAKHDEHRQCGDSVDDGVDELVSKEGHENSSDDQDGTEEEVVLVYEEVEF